jgi:hypothetical protein
MGSARQGDGIVAYEFEKPNSADISFGFILGCLFFVLSGIGFLRLSPEDRNVMVLGMVGSTGLLVLFLVAYLRRVRIRVESRGVWQLPIYWGKRVFLPYSEIEQVSVETVTGKVNFCRCHLEGKGGYITFRDTDTEDFGEIVAYIQSRRAEVGENE